MSTKQKLAIYVDRTNGQWVVRDEQGEFWTLPQTETPWLDRRPHMPAEDDDLEPVPGHYKYLLGVTF